MMKKLPLLTAAALLSGLLMLGGTAAADTFGGFGGREDGYLAGSDKICTPLVVTAGKATGLPACAKAKDDEIAHLSVKDATAMRGRDATHSAAASGRVLTITATAKEKVIVSWEAPDPITKVVNLYLSQYGNLAGVEYNIRRGGRDVTEVVVFDLRGTAGADTTVDPGTTDPEVPTVEAPNATPALTKALKAARKAAKSKPAKAIKAWQKVLAIDPDHSEARFGIAVAQAKAKKKDLALEALEALAASGRSDAIEFLISARFDKAFASLRADARFRAAVGLDKDGSTIYERLMGNGGTWEQAGTSCDQPGVALTLSRDRSFKLKITSVCSGERYVDTFKGNWVEKAPALTLALPNKGRDDEEFSCLIEPDGDEDTIKCELDEDLTFVVRPVRR